MFSLIPKLGLALIIFYSAFALFFFELKAQNMIINLNKAYIEVSQLKVNDSEKNKEEEEDDDEDEDC